jgi:hypothetical protein
MKFNVLTCTDEEMAKHLKDRSYEPVEYVHSTMEAPNESIARARCERGIIAGTYPRGSRVLEVIS